MTHQVIEDVEPLEFHRRALRTVPVEEEPRADVARVLVAGPDVLARRGITAVLGTHLDITVVGDCEPGTAVRPAISRLWPDVLLLHGVREGEPALEATLTAVRHARCTTRVLTVGAGQTPRFDDGVCGALPLSATPEQLVAAVRMASAGYVMISGALPGEDVQAAARDGLTRRECEVLSLIARGLSNAEIALALTLSEHTVKSHVQNLLSKLKLRNRVHAVIYAFEAGLGSRPLTPLV
ncbi:LuxR C-terminal-related transcriptional regulator [Lentzea sp. NPDC051213]|uniref:LuxR C-terminal-related transcriptional regulator n=1 Tax=Lentzea sp. NPDC051213 TaxID=3364126 RepID=UPI0037B6A99A